MMYYHLSDSIGVYLSSLPPVVQVAIRMSLLIGILGILFYIGNQDKKRAEKARNKIFNLKEKSGDNFYEMYGEKLINDCGEKSLKELFSEDEYSKLFTN